MDDRVRVYELARKMNIPNQDIITGLRELGYDIKTHSSTVDANAVGRLIASLNKKKQKEKQAPAKPGSKQSEKVVDPPQAPIVKPRVLSRYRPVAAPIVAEGGIEATASQTSPHTTLSSLTPPFNATATSITRQPGLAQANDSKEATSSTSLAPTPPLSKGTAAGGEHLSAQGRIKGTHPPADKEPGGDFVELLKDQGELDQTKTAVIIDDGVEQANLDNFSPGAAGHAMKSAAPSVPTRIAAPSIRATPPRPPKSHRQTPAERHLPKRDDKVRLAASATTTVELPKVISLTGPLIVKELAERMGIAPEEVITRLMMKDTFRTMNQLVELELAKELAAELEYEVSDEPMISELPAVREEEVLSEADKAAQVQRPPVVTIMGHVDHGKTSLLDAIRQTKFLLTDAEAGGITQHIGAYHVEVPYEDGTMRQIVFLDTPGHEAFTAMRARGAKATDIAILVVAADDGVMPQTIEAIDHAKAANVPIIVAVNKIDKPGAEPTRVLRQLMEHGLVPEEYGGETVCVNVSAKKRTNLDQLLEMILLVADIQDLKANPERPAEGVIIEAELSRGKGAVATALVENGTLSEGDFIVAGSKSGRVKALFDDRGQRVKAAGPSMPVEVLGLDEVPSAGERFEVVADAQAVKLLVEQRKTSQAERRPYHVTLESLHDMLSTGDLQELNVIIKVDVQGTSEAIVKSVHGLSGPEVKVRVLRTASGDISENDVNLAASSNAIIIGFNVQPDQNAARVAEAAGVDIRTYSTIYQIADDLQKAIHGLIQPVRKEAQIGTAEVRQVFKFGKNLTIAGCMVTSGKVTRGAIAKILREGNLIYEGKVETLKRFKDDAKEVASGFECGMSFEKFSDTQEGDVINVFVIQETKRDFAHP